MQSLKMLHTRVFVTICLQAILITANGVPNPNSQRSPEYIGCYNSSFDQFLVFRYPDVQSIGECVEACKNEDFKYAGIQDGKICLCGTINAALPSDKCYMYCENGDDNCGGPFAVSIYRHFIDVPVNAIYIGCYHDIPDDHFLPNRMSDVQSVDECVKICKIAGYEYAGLQNGKQCFCGNENTASPSNKCSMPCQNGDKKCGGPETNSIYRALNTVSVSQNTYVGCFKDNKTRYLPHKMADVESVGECIESCRNAQMNYAGLQFGKECYCGNENDAPASNKCKIKCKNGVETCGGNWANSIYRASFVNICVQIQQPTANRDPDQQRLPEYIGCFIIGKYLTKLISKVQSVGECVEACKNASYQYAGIRSGRYCFCGNENAVIPSDKCYMYCENGDDNCGGSYDVSIYRHFNNVPVNDTYIGCYEDILNQFLPHRMSDVQSVDECVKTCKIAGYEYAGLQFGKQCFCGNENRAPPSDECSMHCQNGDKKCGGRWVNSVYRALNTVFLSKNTYVGCFKDNKTRYLSHKMPDVESVGECVENCRKAKMFYAGLQFGKECYCGNKNNAPASNKCKIKCQNGVETCGGNWANSIYRAYPAYIGCYEDNSSRKLPHQVANVKSVEECAAACRNAGYKYAGAQYGNQCYCGNENNSFDSNNCDMYCENGLEICGGHWANSVCAV